MNTITLIGKRRASFESEEQALDYLQPTLSIGLFTHTIWFFGSPDSFERFRHLVQERLCRPSTATQEVRTRSMWGETSWGDYYDSKYSDEPIRGAQDLSAPWLQYGGDEAPSDFA